MTSLHWPQNNPVPYSESSGSSESSLAVFMFLACCPALLWYQYRLWYMLVTQIYSIPTQHFAILTPSSVPYFCSTSTLPAFPSLNVSTESHKCNKHCFGNSVRWRRKKLLDDLGDRRGYSNLKEETLDRTKWRNRFGRGCGPVVWQITDDDDVWDDRNSPGLCYFPFTMVPLYSYLKPPS
jgi:hypothetical protein